MTIQRKIILITFLAFSFLISNIPSNVEAVNLRKVTGASITNYDTTGYRIGWTWTLDPHHPYYQAPYQFDIIAYYKLPTGGFQIIDDMTTSNTSASFNLNLASCGCPYLNYRLDITAYYNIGGDIFSDFFSSGEVDCEPSCEHSQFTGVSVSGTGVNSFNVSWSGLLHGSPEPQTIRIYVLDEDGIYLHAIDKTYGGSPISVTDDLMSPGTSYKIKIQPLYDGNHYPGNDMWTSGDESSPVSFSTFPSVPTIPINLRAENITTNSITWKWNSVAGATSYNLAVDSPTGYHQTFTVSGTEKINDGLNPSTLYSGRVRACNASGCSSYSNTVNATTLALTCGDNYRGSEGDLSQSACSGFWSLANGNSPSQCWMNGRDNPYLCCGDDSSESGVFCMLGPSIDWSCLSGDTACCAADNSCVKNSSCYSSYGSYSVGDASNGHDHSAICENRIWWDCDVSPIGSPKMLAGESGVGEYEENGGGTQCCGDDPSEFSIWNEAHTQRICCNSSTDTYGAGGSCQGVSIPPVNQPPYALSNPSPFDGATCIPTAPVLILTWTGGDPNPGDSIDYSLFLCSGAGCSPAFRTTVSGTSYGFAPNELITNTLYRWQIVADDGEMQTVGPIWSFTTGSTPSAPSNLNFNNITDSQIRTYWQDNSNNESGFKIYRDTDSTLVYTNGVNDVDWTDSGLACNKNFQYWVSAFNSCGESSKITGSVSTLPCSGSGPDLIIEDISWNPVVPSAGEQVIFTVTIRNQGTTGTGSSVAKYYIDSQYVGEDGNSGIPSGSTRQETFPWTATCGHTHSVKAMADANLEISESNEGNNERTEIININNCPPNAPNLSGPTTGVVGTSYTFIAQSNDPDGDNIMYNFDWGTGSSYNTNFVPSGTPQSASNAWLSEGVYNVCALAADAWAWSNPTCQAINIGFEIPGNENPIANFNFCREPGTQKTVRFTDMSTDSDGTVVSWAWDFGDGETCLSNCNEVGFSGINQNPVHTFSDVSGGGFSYRKKITFDNSSRDENLVDVPVLIKLNSSNIDYAKTQNQGQDIRFADSDGSTNLNYEIEKWNESGDSFVWVQVPQIDESSLNDYIWMKYGSSTASDSQNPTGVWNSNYVMVQHFKETSGKHYDSTSYNNDSKSIDVQIQGSAAGKINGADEFLKQVDGGGEEISSDEVVINDSSSLDLTNALTMEVWARSDMLNYRNRLFTKMNSENYVLRQDINPNGSLQFYANNGSGLFGAKINNVFSSVNLKYMAAAWDGTSGDHKPHLYSNGVEPTTYGYQQVLNGPIRTSNSDLYIGNIDQGWDGIIDEARISKTARSSDWISFQYCSMAQTCISYGNEELVGSSSPSISLVATDDDSGQGSVSKQIDFGTITQCSANYSPQASGFSVSQGDYCLTPSHNFSWTYTDVDNDDEEEFQFQVDDNSGFFSPEVNRTFDGLSYPSGTINSQVVLVSPTAEADKIVYNKTYYWRVKVFDSEGADSGWIQGSSFATRAHQYPLANFTWAPQFPAIDEATQFTDTSQAYGSSTITSRSWLFEGGNPASSGQQNPQVSFGSNGSKTVNLVVTDSGGYSCSVEKEVRVGYALPEWKEVEP